MELTTSVELCQVKKLAGTTKDDLNTHLRRYVPALTLRHGFMTKFCLHGISSCLPWSKNCVTIYFEFECDNSQHRTPSTTGTMFSTRNRSVRYLISHYDVLSYCRDCTGTARSAALSALLRPLACKCIVILSRVVPLAWSEQRLQITKVRHNSLFIVKLTEDSARLASAAKSLARG